MSPKLTRSQLIEARRQAKEAREKELESLKNENEEVYEEKLKEKKAKKDKRGFTSEERRKLQEKKIEINTPKPKVTWNFTEAELVHLPNGDIGIIVKNNARNIEMKYSYVDNKSGIMNPYLGQVYVVTSSGNNWYYPKTLKPVR